MWDTLISWPHWGAVGTGAAWLVTASLLVAGLIGCIIPFLPGHLLLFLAAVSHRLCLGAEGSGLQWWSFVVLLVLMATSQTIEILSGAAGSRWFGGSRWGALGAVVGMIVGLFFLPFGLLLGPLAGAFVAEFAIARKHPRTSAVSGVGSVVGTLAGLAVKIAFGLAMTLWFLADVFWIG